MKTPREILLGRHQNMQPKLDSLRQQIVADLTSAPEQSSRNAGDLGKLEPTGWLQLLLAVRWHLAGLSTVWILVALLRAASVADETPQAVQAQSEPPRAVIVLLKENRRQIMELGGLSTGSVPAIVPAVPKSRRSSVQPDWAYS